MGYTQLFTFLTDNIQNIVFHGGYTFLFFAVFLEGLPLIGTIVPGHVAVIVAGFLAKIGILSLWPVIIISAVAAIFGDFVGFKLGRKYGISLVDKLRPYFFIKDSHVTKANELLHKHTGKALIIGRFSPITRALMPFLVGTSEASSGKFWFYNVMGGLSWILSSIFIGYAFGASYHVVSGYLGKAAMIVLILAAFIIWGYRFVNARFHIFRRYELFVLGLNILSLWGLAETIQDAWANKSFMATFDVWVNVFINDHITPFFSSLANILSNFGGTLSLNTIGLMIAIWLVFKEKWRSATIMLFALGSSDFLVGSMKLLFLRDRPENALNFVIGDPSFPSGHATIAAAFFIALVYLFAPKINSWIKRELLIVISTLFVIAIGLSRIVLNMHWVSDVLAGWCLGIFCATGSILLVRYLGALILSKNADKFESLDKQSS